MIEFDFGSGSGKGRIGEMITSLFRATAADQEQKRDRAQRNLEAIKEADIDATNTREVISGIWMRSLSAALCPSRTTWLPRGEQCLDG